MAVLGYWLLAIVPVAALAYLMLRAWRRHAAAAVLLVLSSTIGLFVVAIGQRQLLVAVAITLGALWVAGALTVVGAQVPGTTRRSRWWTVLGSAALLVLFGGVAFLTYLIGWVGPQVDAAGTSCPLVAEPDPSNAQACEPYVDYGQLVVGGLVVVLAVAGVLLLLARSFRRQQRPARLEAGELAGEEVL